MNTEAVKDYLQGSYAFCRQVAHLYGANFSLGFRFLPRTKRKAVYAVYAFCRFVDDIVDEQAGTDIQSQIDRWEEELERCYKGQPTHPITVALADAAARYPISKSSFTSLIEGCRMDLVKKRYANFNELLVYSDLVATTISTMSLAIFGYRDELALQRGRDLATAFQLTNILRDVGEDIDKNRIYLPMDEVERFGVSEEDLLAKHSTQGFRQLMQFQVERVHQFYSRAAAVLTLIEPDARRCTRLMGSVYYQVLTRIEALDYPVLRKRVGLSLPKKIQLVTETYLTSTPTWI